MFGLLYQHLARYVLDVKIPSEEDRQRTFDGYASSPLSKLPPELILYIVAFLPSESAALFALTCHRMMVTIGTTHLTSLTKSSYLSRKLDYKSEHYIGSTAFTEATLSPRSRLLLLLQRDLPDYVACAHCEELHAISRAKKYDLGGKYWFRDKTFVPECWRGRMSQGIVHDRFMYVIAMMAMKRHWQGNQQRTEELLKMLCQERQTGLCGTKKDLWNMSEKRVQSQTITDIRIVADNLLMLKRCILSIDSPLFLWDAVSVTFCLHARNVTPLGTGRHDVYRNILRATRSRWRSQPVKGPFTIYAQCPHCYTEVQVDMGYDGLWSTLIIRIRKDLGRGELLDGNWMRHLSYGGSLPLQALPRRDVSLASLWEDQIVFK